MRGFWKNRKGYVMAYVTILIGTLAIPMMTISVEIVRAMYVENQLQAAVDAACEAAVQSVDIPYFMEWGILQIQMGPAVSYAHREFDATVISHNINNYNPLLSGVSLLPNSLTMVQCSGSATMGWFIPGVPDLTLHADSVSQARMSSN